MGLPFNQNQDSTYEMSISLSVLNHLGIGLYSNVPAVLSEVVANAWDADAENVYIDINPNQGVITIYDDGNGMTRDDINQKYLNVGYSKREREPDYGVTPKFNRQPMGRKGIGKLSVFSIAKIIEVHTVKLHQKNAFRMDSRKIQDKIQGKTDGTYHPETLSTDTVEIEKGTKIILNELMKDIKALHSYLRRRLARRFSVIGTSNNFEVYINDEPISAKDRDYYKHIQFLWYFGEKSEHYNELCMNSEKNVLWDPNIDKIEKWKISGWIGTVEKQKQIDEDTNGIVIFANGKLAHENLLKDLKEGGVWTKYIIGEIDADFMDDNTREDIVTSARQSLKEDDIRYEALRDFLQKHGGVLRHIGTNWQKWRRELGADKVLKERKNIKKWYDRLEGDQRAQAKQLFGKIEALDEMEEEGKKELYKASMYAFERLTLTNQLSLLQSLETENDFELISNIFGNLTDLERVHYYNIANLRVEIIKKFREIVDNDKKERVIQDHIFKSLWLLDPSWDHSAINSHMEESVTTEFTKLDKNKLSDEERKGRVDIRYQTVAGKHVIIELKKYSVKLSVYKILEQVSKYKSTLRKSLESYYPEVANNMAIEVICITGQQLTGGTADEISNLLLASNVRHKTYDELLQSALRSYEDYLQAEKRISELVAIIDSIDEDFEN